MARKTLKGVGVAAWLGVYAVLAFRSGWGLLPAIGLCVGLVMFASEITAALHAVRRFLVDAFDVACLVISEFARPPASREQLADPTPLPIRERAKAKRAA